MPFLLTRLNQWRTAFQPVILCLGAIALLLNCFTPAALASGVYDFPFPKPGNWIVDKAEVISRANEGTINSQLSKLAKQTGYEVHLVTMHRLDYGETIDSFTNSLFATWFPTPEAQANQVILALDDLTNNSAIRTGNGVKSALSDEIAASIAEENVLIPLKEDNKYNQALLSASDRLVAVLSGQADPGAPTLKDDVQTEGTFATRATTNEGRTGFTLWVVGLLLAATVIPMATYYWYVR